MSEQISTTEVNEAATQSYTKYKQAEEARSAGVQAVEQSVGEATELRSQIAENRRQDGDRDPTPEETAALKDKYAKIGEKTLQAQDAGFEAEIATFEGGVDYRANSDAYRDAALETAKAEGVAINEGQAPELAQSVEPQQKG